MKRFFLCYFFTLLLMALLLAIILVGLFLAFVSPSAVARQEHYSFDDLSAEVVYSSPCHGVSQSQKGAWHPVYVVVITAAESWSSVNSFAFHRCCLDNRFLLQKADYFTLEESIINYAKGSRKIRHLLQPLVDRAKKFVPINVQKDTNILFRATPVLRDVVPKKEIHKLLLRARSVLRHSSFRMQSSEATIRATSDEAADLWLSAVFLTGRIYRKNPSQLAVVDLSSGLLRVAIPVAMPTVSENIPAPKKDDESAMKAKKYKNKNSKTSNQRLINKRERVDLNRRAKRDSPPGANFGKEQKAKFGKSITDSENISSVEKTPEESKGSIINAFRRRILSFPKEEPLQSGRNKTSHESLLSVLHRKLIIYEDRKKDPLVKRKRFKNFNNEFDPRKHPLGNVNSIVSKPEEKSKVVFNTIYKRDCWSVLNFLQQNSSLNSRVQKSLSGQIWNYNKSERQKPFKVKEQNMFLTSNAIKTNNSDKLKTLIELNTNVKNSSQFLRKAKFNSYNVKIKNISFIFTDFNYGPKRLWRCERAKENCKEIIREEKRHTKKYNSFNANASKEYVKEIKKNQPESLNKFKRATKKERNGELKELYSTLKTFKALFWINCKKLNVFPKIVTLKRQLEQKSKYSTIKLENFGPGRCNSTDFGGTIFWEKVNNFSVRKRRRNFLHIFLHNGKLNCGDTFYYFKNCFLEINNNSEVVKRKNWSDVNSDVIFDQFYEMLFTNGREKDRAHKGRKKMEEKKRGMKGNNIIEETEGTKRDQRNKQISAVNEMTKKEIKINTENLPMAIIINLEKEIKHKIKEKSNKFIKENNNKSKGFFFRDMTKNFHAHKPSLKKEMAAKKFGKKEKFENKSEHEQKFKERQSISTLFKVNKRDIKSKTKGFYWRKTMSSNSLGNNRTTTIKTKGKKNNQNKKIRVKRDSRPEVKNDLRNKNFLSNKVKNLLKKNERFYFKSMFLEGKRFIRPENNLVFLFNPNKCIISWTKNRTVHCRWEQSLILALRRTNNLFVALVSSIQFNRISRELQSKTRIWNTAQMGVKAHSTQREEVVQGQRPTKNIVDNWKWPRIKIVAPMQSVGMMNVERNESFDKEAFILWLQRLPSHLLKYYLFATNIGANDPSKLPVAKFFKKVNSQSIRKIAFQTPNGENDRPTKNNQSRKIGENSDRSDVSGISSENNYLPDKVFFQKFWISTFSARTPQNNNRNSKNRRQNIRKIVKKRKRATGNRERKRVNITSRCFAGNKIWLFATSYPLGIYPARVSVLLGANSSSSIERPSQFGSPQPFPSPSGTNMMISSKSAQEKRRSDVSPEKEYTVTSSQRASHPIGTLSFQPRGPGPPSTSSPYVKAKMDSDHFNSISHEKPADLTSASSTETNKEMNVFQTTSEEANFTEKDSAARLPPLSDPHSETSIWPKGTLENIKGVVDSILMAIGSSSQTTENNATPSSTVPPVTTDVPSVTSYNNSIIPLEKYKNHSREFSRERLKKTELRVRKNSSSIFTKNPLVRNVTEINEENKTDYADKILHPKYINKNLSGKYKRSFSNSLNVFNNSSIKYNDYKNTSDVRKRDPATNTSDNSTNITERERRHFGTISSVTDLLFTVPNLRVSIPEENSQIDSEIKLTEKLIRSSLKDFLIFVPDSVLTEEDNNKTKEDSENIFEKLTFPIFRLDQNLFSESSVENKRFVQIEPLTKPMEELILKSSCIPAGSIGRFSIDDVTYTVVGKGDIENGTKTCWQEVTKVIDKHFSIPSVKGMDLLASTAFYFIASKANLIDHESGFGYVKPILFKSAADEMCGRHPENLPDPLACLDYQFLAAILLHGFNLPEDKDIMVCEAVGDFRMNSALGAAVNFLQRQHL